MLGSSNGIDEFSNRRDGHNEVPPETRHQDELLKKAIEEEFSIYLDHIYDDLYLKEMH
jgi:hypothetical protein